MAEEFDRVFVILVAVISVLEMVAGLVTNLGVLIISRDSNKKHWERGNSFNLNLNVVDSIMCVTIIPLTLAYVVTTRFQTPMFCFILEGTISFTSTASSLTLFFICLDRYYAVTTPTQPHIISTKSEFFVMLVWLMATFSFCLPFFGLKVDMLQSFSKSNNSFMTCSEIIWSMEPHYIHEVFYLVSFLATACGMVLFYSSVTSVTKRRVAIKEALVKASLSFGVKISTPRETEKKTLKLPLLTVFAFLLFWGPHLIVCVVTMIVRDSVALDMTRVVCLLFAFLTTIIHPLLYAFIRETFRQAFRKRFLQREIATVGAIANDGKITTIEVETTSNN